jgi:type IV pilus assembly protein PilE
MVVVAVLAILATIAIPAYENQIRASRRADGRAAATAVALALERRFSIYQRYRDADGDDEVDFAELIKEAGLEDALKGGKSAKGYYTFEVAFGGAGQPAFTITVDPVAGQSQADDKYCTQMTLDATGKKSGTPASGYDNRCW